MQGPPALTYRPDAYAAELATAGRGKMGRALPWFLSILVAGGAGALVFTYNKDLVAARAALDDTRAELAAVRGAEDDAQRRAADAETQLAAAKASLGDEREKLEQELAAVQAKAAEADELQKKLKEIGQGEVSREDDRLTVQLVDRVLFPLGQSELTPQGKKVLARFGAIVQEFPDKQIWVQGHTDRVPVKGDAYDSNWDLSAARALSVVHFLQEEVGVSPKRMAAVAFGEHRPVVRKKKAARNRRIEIVLFPEKVKLVR